MTMAPPQGYGAVSDGQDEEALIKLNKAQSTGITESSAEETTNTTTEALSLVQFDSSV